MYRAVDQHGQVIDVVVSERRDIEAASRFFTTSLTAQGEPVEVVTERAPALARVIDEPLPAAFHNTEQCQKNRCEADHGRRKSRPRPIRGMTTNRTASVVIHGHACLQNIRRGHHELAVEASPKDRLATAFYELHHAI